MSWPRIVPAKIEPYSALVAHPGAVSPSRAMRSTAIELSVKLYVAVNCAAIPISSDASIQSHGERGEHFAAAAPSADSSPRFDSSAMVPGLAQV